MKRIKNVFKNIIVPLISGFLIAFLVMAFIYFSNEVLKGFERIINGIVCGEIFY